MHLTATGVQLLKYSLGCMRSFVLTMASFWAVYGATIGLLYGLCDLNVLRFLSTFRGGVNRSTIRGATQQVASISTLQSESALLQSH